MPCQQRLCRIYQQSIGYQKSAFNCQRLDYHSSSGGRFPVYDPYIQLTQPQVDVATYRKLVKAVASCYSGTCDGPKIRAFFVSYLDKAEGMIDSDLVQMLNDWVALFASLKQKTTDVQTYAKQVQSRLKSVSSKVESVKASVCRNSACKGSTPSNAFKKCK